MLYFYSVGFCIISCKIPPESLLFSPQLFWIEHTQWNRKNSLSSFVQHCESVWPVLSKPQKQSRQPPRGEKTYSTADDFEKKGCVIMGQAQRAVLLLLFCVVCTGVSDSCNNCRIQKMHVSAQHYNNSSSITVKPIFTGGRTAAILKQCPLTKIPELRKQAIH